MHDGQMYCFEVSAQERHAKKKEASGSRWLQKIGGSFLCVVKTELRHSAHSFFLPAWLVPTCTSFTSPTAFLLPSGRFYLFSRWFEPAVSMPLRAVLWRGSFKLPLFCHHLTDDPRCRLKIFPEAEAEKRLKHDSLCYDTQVGKLLYKHTCCTSFHEWPAQHGHMPILNR